MFVKMFRSNHPMYTFNLNGYEKPIGFVDYYKPKLELLTDRTFSLAVDPGTNNMSIAIGDDSCREPFIVFELQRDQSDMDSTDFSNKAIEFFIGIIESIKGVLRQVYIETPVYLRYNSSRNNSYATLKALQTRFSTVLNTYGVDYIAKPATTWRGVTLKPLKGIVDLRKVSKAEIRALLFKTYLNFFRTSGKMKDDSYEAVGMLYYLYSFYTNSDAIQVSLHTPRVNSLDGCITNIDIVENKEQLLTDYVNMGYKIYEFIYCNEMDVEDNLKSLIAQVNKSDKCVYYAVIDNSISVMKYVALHKKLSDITPDSQFIVIGGWLR